MTVPLDRPIVCPIVVGRGPHLEALDQALEDARLGRGQVVLIAGEAGIGKSRLVREARARAESLGLLTLQGACFEPDRTLPYAPLLDLLRALLEVYPAPEIAALLGRDAHALALLLPELAAELADLPARQHGPEEEKRRLFAAFSRLFERLAGERPLLLVVEDLHWGDDASLELLGSLGRRLAARPILLLLTYRDDEALQGLARLLSELDRERLAIELRPGRLSVPELDAMLRATLGLDRSVRADLLHAMYALTDGNPFFVEEVLRTLVPPGGAWAAVAGRATPLAELRIPRSVKDAVQRRVERVSPGARDALQLAAVVGRRFDFGLLQALLGCDEGDLLGWIKELIAAQLVVEESAERFAFRHALTREAVAAELLALERRVLHRRVAEALEGLPGAGVDAHLEDLGYHYAEAAAWDRALPLARRAGQRALALYAPRAAVEHFSRALEAAHQLQLPPSADLYLGRGRAHETLGDFEAASADLEAARALARAAGDRRQEWQTLLALGTLWSWRDYERAGALARAALELARAAGDPALLAHSLNRVGNWHLNVEQQRAALNRHREALAAFEALGDRHATAETLGLLAMASYLAGELQPGTAYCQRAVEQFRELDDRQGLCYSLATLALGAPTFCTDTLVPALSLEEAVAACEAAVRIAREIDWRAGETFARFNLGFSLAGLGDYGNALAATDAARAIAEEIEHREWLAAAHLVLGELHHELLAPAPARAHLRRALALAREASSEIWIHYGSAVLASALVAQGELGEARALLNDAFPADGPPDSLARRIAAHARAELALAGGEAALAVHRAEALAAFAPAGAPPATAPRLALLRGRALVALGRHDQAEAALQAALDAAEAQHARPLAWRILAALATLHHARGRREEAEQMAARSRAVVEQIAATVPDEALSAGFIRAALMALPTPRPPAARRTAREAFGGLTAREREVAALVTQGMSNRAVAEALVLSERTAEKHVGSILAKLGLASRAQIAAWAVRQGLARD